LAAHAKRLMMSPTHSIRSRHGRDSEPGRAGKGQDFEFSSDVDLTNGTAHRAITNRHIYAVAANAS
jgi:hypothetical protein